MITSEAISFPAIGTTATVVVPVGDRDAALEAVRAEIEAMDRACSRFRADSELAAVNGSSGRPCQVSPLFLEALEAALRAARLTGGIVDPTVGSALRVLGYDRDYASIDPDGPPVKVSLGPVAGWKTVVVDRAQRTVTVPSGVELDFGATAKALLADRAAEKASALTGAGVLVSLGGDISVAGAAPPGGWTVGLADRHCEPPRQDLYTVAVRSGGLATSSTTARRWRRGGDEMHHLVHPSSGFPAEEYWRTATVAAASCLDANIASTAAIILGPGAASWLGERGLPARLVRRDGTAVAVGGWIAQRGDRAIEDPSGPLGQRAFSR